MVVPGHKESPPKAWRVPQEGPDDTVLIDRISRGDLLALESLFRRYGPRLRRFLEPLARRRQLIDEILNDTMLVIWRKAGTFNGRSKASTWILGIALRRGLKTIKHFDRTVALDTIEIDKPKDSDPEEHVCRNELRVRLDRALESLSPEHRTVVVLTYFEGYSCREIATIVGCPVDTVKTRMFHARRRLKVLLADRREDVA